MSAHYHDHQSNESEDSSHTHNHDHAHSSSIGTLKGGCSDQSHVNTHHNNHIELSHSEGDVDNHVISVHEVESYEESSQCGHDNAHGHDHSHTHAHGLNDAEVNLNWKYAIVIFLTGSFLVLELTFGIILSSLALRADAVHMLSDLIALIVALYSSRMAKEPSSDIATFGYHRANALGGFINCVFLISSCVFITLDVIERFAEWQTIGSNFGNPITLLIVASVGLGINLFSASLFMCDESGAHAGHNHDDMNTRAILLHILGDMLGSLAVIASALIIEYSESDARFLADPVATLLIVLIILYNAIPVLRQCYDLLLQTAPKAVDCGEMKARIGQVNGVANIHDFHVWSLSTSKRIGTMHVRLNEGVSYSPVMQEVQVIMHDSGVHATTIQLEYYVDGINHGRKCSDIVCAMATCVENRCCAL